MAERNSRKIRIAILGGGPDSTSHWNDLPWNRHPQCTVAALVNLPGPREQNSRRFECSVHCDSLDELLNKGENIDAAAIYSGVPNHARHAIVCLERGWHVASAYPACLSLEEAERLKHAKEKTGGKYMMTEPSCFEPATSYARERYRNGDIGEIFYSELEYYQDRGDLKQLITSKDSRFYLPDGSRSWRWGLPPMFYPTHCLGFLVPVTGERILKVSGLGWGTSHEYLTQNNYHNPFWNESALMTTDRGHMCRCNVFWLCAGQATRAQWFGSKGSLYMESPGLHGIRQVDKSGQIITPVIAEPRRLTGLPEALYSPSGYPGAAAFMVHEFIDALSRDREPEIDLYRSLAMTVPGIVAHQSALRGGIQLDVPQFDKIQ